MRAHEGRCVRVPVVNEGNGNDHLPVSSLGDPPCTTSVSKTDRPDSDRRLHMRQLVRFSRSREWTDHSEHGEIDRNWAETTVSGRDDYRRGNGQFLLMSPGWASHSDSDPNVENTRHMQDSDEDYKRC